MKIYGAKKTKKIKIEYKFEIALTISSNYKYLY